MRHLRTFESYLSPEEEDETKSYFSEEEDDDKGYDFEEEDDDMAWNSEEDDDKAYYSDEDETEYGHEEDEMGGHINSFHAFNEESCPSCNCTKCECGGGMAYEAKKAGKSYKESGLKNPSKADLNKDKKINSYEQKRGGAIQSSMEKKKGEKPKAQAQKSVQKAAQKDEKKKVK